MSTATIARALLSIVDVTAITGFSRATIYRKIDAGLMPRPMKNGASTRWDAREFQAWIDGGCKPVPKTR